jgi:hypothetical protein
MTTISKEKKYWHIANGNPYEIQSICTVTWQEDGTFQMGYLGWSLPS